MTTKAYPMTPSGGWEVRQGERGWDWRVRQGGGEITGTEATEAEAEREALHHWQWLQKQFGGAREPDEPKPLRRAVDQPWWINATEQPPQVGELKKALVRAGLCDWRDAGKPYPLEIALVAWWTLNGGPAREAEEEMRAYWAATEADVA